MIKAAPLLYKQKELSILSMSFQDKQLTINFTAPGFDDLEALQQSLSKLGITISQVSATTKDKRVNATWRLS